MEEKINLDDFDEHDVICFNEHNVFKMGKLMPGIEGAIKSQDVANAFVNALQRHGISIKVGEMLNDRFQDCYGWWFTEGVGCEILQPGSSRWKKGKVKLNFTLEFYPEAEECIPLL
ncbi:hypothetical protein BST81_14935 [Leptolyngbya sp. 'hensonii']|uniref:KGK domain-containing protein n=1 Tax=Leptolyngbya sp. 'hensonii' TaxID=1922337 RepID=UPI00094F4ECE|nr:KGK domain-containing protein [Leptolyngbya sp. 'hensonii']OLP17618.1 hypothetical protein BST81_14935 [Leptolyngbya sp. 'hensonii']